MLLTDSVFSPILEHQCGDSGCCGEDYVLDEGTVRKMQNREPVLMPKEYNASFKNRNLPAVERFVKACISCINWTITDPNWKYHKGTIKIPLKCDLGHSIEIAWNPLSRGIRCGVCSGRYSVNTEIVKKTWAEAAWILSDPDWEYVNSNTPIPYICSIGHQGEIVWGAFSQGVRCGKCAGKHKTDDSVRAFVQSKSWEIDPDAKDWHYQGAKHKIPLICPRGHKTSISWTNFQTGYGCGLCYQEDKFLTDEDREIKRIQYRLWNADHMRLKRDLIRLEKDNSFEAFHPTAKVLFSRYHRAPNEDEQIDHIIPRSYFNPENPLEIYFRDCPDNLRYMFWRDNLSKNRYLKKELFLNFNQTQIFILSIASKRHKYCPDSDDWIREAGFSFLLS